MPRKTENAVAMQRRYYEETASRYDTMHARECDDDAWNLTLVSALLRAIGAHSVLDVGAGTGRGIRRLSADLPGIHACGVEPVGALIDQAIAKSESFYPMYVQGSGEALPFRDASFDAVCSFAILHHVPKPSLVVGEMLRVARKAVLIVDSNRFGQGRWAVRVAKLGLYKTGLWRLVNYAKTRGKQYLFTEGDGVAYSYSAYDSFDQIAEWADRLMVIPAEPGKARSWLHPLLTTGGVLVCAIKETRT
ncbi:MAG: class I SAM-dependent methyltransferase [Candidatus Acidiferrales bacterium]